MPPPSTFKSIKVDKGTKWDRQHQTLSQLGSKEVKYHRTIDLRPGFLKARIEVETSTHACTANAICAAWRYVQAHIDKRFSPSRLFLYYNERLAEGTTKEDPGAFISDGCRSLEQFGLCSASTWPYKPENEPVKPPPEAYKEALAHVIHTPAQISNDTNDLKDSLVQHKPFVVGIALFSEFMSDAVRCTGVVPMPTPGVSQPKGHHAVTCVGYDDDKQHWIFRNSWGADWGDRGHFYLPYEYLAVEGHLASDFWNLSTDRSREMTKDEWFKRMTFMKKLDMGEKPSKFLWEKVCREIDAGKLDKEEVKELEAILQMIYDEGDRRDDEREEREFDGKVEAL